MRNWQWEPSRNVPRPVFALVVVVLLSFLYAAVVSIRSSTPEIPAVDLVAERRRMAERQVRLQINDYLRSGNTAAARMKLEEFLKLAPSSPAAIALRAQLESESASNEVSRQQSRLSREKYDQGMAYLNEEDYARSIPLLEEAFSINPSDAEVARALQSARENQALVDGSRDGRALRAKPSDDARMATTTSRTDEGSASDAVGSRALPPHGIDQLLARTANIAFNTPEQLTVNELRVVQLVLDPTRKVARLEERIQEPGRIDSATIKIASRVKAHLAGSAFEIRPITAEEQGISESEATEWKWEVRAREPGNHRLFLTVDAIVGTGRNEVRRSVRTFDRRIEVQVIKAPAALWAVSIVTAVIAAVVIIWRRRAKTAMKASLAPTPRAVAFARAAAFSPGDLIASRYRVTRFLGRGGMGSAYAVEDLEFGGETVALKTIVDSRENADAGVARFKREVQLARRVAHPNVCRVFDVGYDMSGDQKLIFVTMQYIAGKTLSQYIREKGRLSEAEALPIVKDIALGLHATHDCGLIHRDVKSANVMLADAGGRAVLMDFGIACLNHGEPAVESLTHTGAIVGSLLYMAPEQIEGATLAPTADVYSLGMVIYEMVTGRLPYEGDTPFAIVAKRLDTMPIPPDRFVPGLSASWVNAVMTCLEREPSQRFQRAIAVADALESSSDLETSRRPFPESSPTRPV